MGKFIDLTGQKFGKLFVIKRDEEKNNISFCEQYSFSDLKGDVSPLKFDFAIFKKGQLKYLIEFQGKQHYEPIEYFGG